LWSLSWSLHFSFKYCLFKPEQAISVRVSATL